jgi:hypothetical protein
MATDMKALRKQLQEAVYVCQTLAARESMFIGTYPSPTAALAKCRQDLLLARQRRDDIEGQLAR